MCVDILTETTNKSSRSCQRAQQFGYMPSDGSTCFGHIISSITRCRSGGPRDPSGCPGKPSSPILWWLHGSACPVSCVLLGQTKATRALLGSPQLKEPKGNKKWFKTIYEVLSFIEYLGNLVGAHPISLGSYSWSVPN